MSNKGYNVPNSPYKPRTTGRQYNPAKRIVKEEYGEAGGRVWVSGVPPMESKRVTSIDIIEDLNIRIFDELYRIAQEKGLFNL